MILHYGVRLVFGHVAKTDDTIVKNTCKSKADARTRTADPFITSDQVDVRIALQIRLYDVRGQA